MGILVFQRMVPFRLVEPSTLYAYIDFGSRCNGKFAREKSPRSRKFLVAPELTRAVVSTICVPTSSLTGKQRVLSFFEATSTWEEVREDNVKVASHFKNPNPWIREQSPPWVLRNTFGELGEFRRHSSPGSSGS
jgi:hypothetical protein